VDTDRLLSLTAEAWGSHVLESLQAFGKIPCLSPMFDASWQDHGLLADAAGLLAGWVRERIAGGGLGGTEVEVLTLSGLTPALVVEVPPSDPAVTGTVLCYGHFDKQPPFDGWEDGLGPWTPVRRGDRLYGRGLADDGYSVFAAITALEALRGAGGRHGRCVIVIEGSEESGSPDLRAYLDHLADRIGSPGLVVALDSGAPTYDRLWATTSLRGFVGGRLSATVLEQGVHSGSAGGAVPSSFAVIRRLLDQIEDATTGEVLVPELRAAVPAGARERAEAMVAAVRASGSDPDAEWPLVPGLTLLGTDAADRALRTSWSSTLAITGADGLPATEVAGNVLRPSTAVKLAIRVPPTCDTEAALGALTRALTEDPPFGSRVAFESEAAADGWAARAFAPWFGDALEAASAACFGAPPGFVGEGGSIPFVGWLAAQFPAAEMLVTGVLGPESNAHGPNEMLHLPTAERITASVAMILDAHASHEVDAAG
jgi:acetylornithine deacetylase/succinyl-diaminopimelate desuccinylase-like protein